MVGVFLVFATLQFLDFKQLGIGLAAAVLIDATIIRGVLLPASMKVLGDWNWYLPSWLEWLPRIGQEDDSPKPPKGPTDAPGADDPEAEPKPAPVPARWTGAR
jgi:RND superfamily putative drug exporter